jgi:hypothetical protein
VYLVFGSVSPFLELCRFFGHWPSAASGFISVSRGLLFVTACLLAPLVRGFVFNICRFKNKIKNIILVHKQQSDSTIV